jgi:hypothetical protein
MSRIVDNLIAYRILSMLVTPFEDTKAYKLGIIDKAGKNLKKASTLKTTEEKDSYTYLHRLVFNMKKIINKIGGENKLKSLVAALWLVKEQYESGNRSTALMEEKYKKILETVNNNVILVEEEIAVRKFFEEAPVNATGAAVSTNEPVIQKKDIKKYQIMAKRKPVNVSA